MEISLWGTGLALFFLTIFLDALELSFARILWFVRTLRFWLYFTLHFLLSCLAAYFLQKAVPEWYLLAPVATFLAVAVISNTDVKVAGYSLVPIAQLFVSIKAKMFEQAADDKAAEVAKATLIGRLQVISIARVQAGYTAGLLGAGFNADQVDRRLNRARQRATTDELFKLMLIDELMKANPKYAEQNIDNWEKA